MEALKRVRTVAGMLLAGVLVSGGVPKAQDASVAELSAAYIISFVRFTTWPPDALPPRVPIVICVGGNDWVADTLVQLVRNQEIEGRTLSIRRVNDSVEGCHVFYGSNLVGAQAERLLRTTSRMPILTMSDATDFAQRGGVANFFIDNRRVRFAVNPHAVARARLQISSRLLSLAKLVGS
jgi:hypothetical protein